MYLLLDSTARSPHPNPLPEGEGINSFSLRDSLQSQLDWEKAGMRGSIRNVSLSTAVFRFKAVRLLGGRKNATLQVV
jgi:hypothetical protein